jgi:hypothetical protein
MILEQVLLLSPTNATTLRNPTNAVEPIALRPFAVEYPMLEKLLPEAGAWTRFVKPNLPQCDERE